MNVVREAVASASSGAGELRGRFGMGTGRL